MCTLSEYHMIAKFPQPPKNNENRWNQVRFNEKGNRACDNGENNSDKKIYAYMACMSGKDACPRETFGDSSKLTNWVLDYEATCHMTQEVSDCITGSIEKTDKYIEIADGHHGMEKHKIEVQIKMCDNHGDNFIETLHNILLEQTYATGFSIISLVNSGHNCLFNEGFCTVYFGAKDNNAVTFP